MGTRPGDAAARWPRRAAAAPRSCGAEGRACLAGCGGRQRTELIAAAYVHDIGYAEALRRSDLHQLDGAAFLRAEGWERLACLVAHHSAARFELELRGFGEELSSYPHEKSAVADALTYCDITTGPTGEDVTLEERVREVEGRYGTDSLVMRALRMATPHLGGAIERTEQRLQAAGALKAAQPR